MCTGTHPFIPAANTAVVANRCLYDGQRVENVMHVTKDDGLTAADVDLAANIVSNWFHTNMLPLLTLNMQMLEVFAQDLQSEGGYETTNVGHANAPGTNSVDPMPNNVSWCLKLNTPVAGPSGHGRQFLFGLGRNQVVGNSIVPASATAFVNAYATLLGDLLLDGFVLSVVSYCHHNVWRTAALVIPVTSVGYSDLVVDTQRRRSPGRGR